MRYSSSISQSPGHRGLRLTISAKMVPTLHMSTLGVYVRCPRRISGALYHRVTTCMDISNELMGVCTCKCAWTIARALLDAAEIGGPRPLRDFGEAGSASSRMAGQRHYIATNTHLKWCSLCWKLTS